MNDIIEIYDPVYRESFNFIPLIISALVIILGLIIFMIIKANINKSKEPTPKERYEKALDRFLELQKNVSVMNSYEFANNVMTIFKNYLSNTYRTGFTALTTEQLIVELGNEESKNATELWTMLKDEVLIAQFGKHEITTDMKYTIISGCVDYINEIYKEVNTTND